MILLRLLLLELSPSMVDPKQVMGAVHGNMLAYFISYGVSLAMFALTYLLSAFYFNRGQYMS